MLRIAVDASCLGNPGLVQYRGVNLDTKEEIFCSSQVEGGTNNIGEFLAVVRAMQYLYDWKQTGEIYTDSKTALSWIRNGEMNTQADRDEMDDDLINDIDFAETFLEVHGAKYKDCIGFWDTKKKGENPADFGRKGNGKPAIPVGTSTGKNVVPHNLKPVAPPFMRGEHHNYPFNKETGKGFTEVQLEFLDRVIDTPIRNVGFTMLSEIEVKFSALNLDVFTRSRKVIYTIGVNSFTVEEATIGQSLAKFVKEFPTLILKTVRNGNCAD